MNLFFALALIGIAIGRVAGAYLWIAWAREATDG